MNGINHFKWAAVFSILLICLQSCTGSNTGSNITEGIPKLTANLLIVCDKELSDRFQQDRPKILDFWRTYIASVNLSFRTLTSVNISFQVTSVITIQNKSEQPFIESNRLSDGTPEFRQSFRDFANWVYINEEKYPSFDIAILATDAISESNTNRAWFYGSSACQKDHDKKIYKSTVAFSSKLFDCVTLGMGLASLLGAPFDHKTSCSGRNFLMDHPYCGQKHHFFSKCSNDGIAAYVNTSAAACLKTNKDLSVDILKSLSTAPVPPTLREQCALRTTSSNVVTAVEGDNPCHVTKCHVTQNEGVNKTLDLRPLDYTQCGGNKACFRGRCLPQGYSIQNIGSQKCIQSENRFSSDGYALLTTCTDSSLLDQIMILDESSSGKYLATPYSSPNADENEDKCLFVGEGDYLQYTRCSTGKVEQLGWDLLLSRDNASFLLRHRHTNSCATHGCDVAVKLTSVCDENNPDMLWKLPSNHNIPRSWFTVNNEVISRSARNASVELSTLPSLPDKEKQVQVPTQLLIPTSFGFQFPFFNLTFSKVNSSTAGLLTPLYSVHVESNNE